MYEFSAGTAAFEVTYRRYGLEHLGVSPGGAADQLSFETAAILLGEPEKLRCSEIVFGSHVTFKEAVLFTVTGAHLASLSLQQGRQKQHLQHAQVYSAQAGDTLFFGPKRRGFRIYLAATPLDERNRIRVGRARGSYAEWFGELPVALRFFAGPEVALLKAPDAFFRNPWTISADSGQMGIRLDGEPLQAQRYDIVSSAVDDGTVQLTASGPIVLMRGRQTTGGYPRIFQLCGSDVDLLAQMAPGNRIRCERISPEEAKALTRKRSKELKALRTALR